MQTTENSEHELGQLLVTPVYASFADNISMTTSDGGRLVFRSELVRDPADGPPEVSVSCLASVSPIPRHGNDDCNLFALTTAIADEAGCLWQRTRIVTVGEIWMTILEEPMLYQVFERPPDEPRYRKAEGVTRRVLLEPVETLFDGRGRSFIEVIRELERDSSATSREVTPYEFHERLLFRLRFHYFGAEIGLIEEDPTARNPNTGELVHRRELVITILPHTDADAITVLGPRDELVSTEGHQLSSLGKLCVRGSHLRARWDLPARDLPRASDIILWHEKYRELGISPESIRAFKPNPAIRYETGGQC